MTVGNFLAGRVVSDIYWCRHRDLLGGVATSMTVIALSLSHLTSFARSTMNALYNQPTGKASVLGMPRVDTAQHIDVGVGLSAELGYVFPVE